MDPTAIVGYTTDSNVVGYSQNDFIWASIGRPGSCLSNGTNCDTNNGVTGNEETCVTQAWCKNKAYSEQILALQSVHTGADVRYLDTKTQYNRQLVTTVNLGVGILGIGLFIFYNH